MKIKVEVEVPEKRCWACDYAVEPNGVRVECILFNRQDVTDGEPCAPCVEARKGCK